MSIEPAGLAARPVPVPDELSAPFWAAARTGSLVVQRCQGCGRHYYPPVPVCLGCSGSDLAFAPSSGRGRVTSYAISYDQHVQGFEHRTPYALVYVELDDAPGVVMMTNLVESPLDAVRIGAEVEVTFEVLSDEVALPQFRARA